MQLTDDFTVSAPADRLWELLNDVEQIAPCVPGFTLAESDHPDYRGQMKIKVGAITVQYDATIAFVERDESARRVVLAVRGKELRGPGSVDATVTSSLTERGQETTVEMVTDVQLTGRVAQFGRGIIADVSSRLIEQFVDRLNTRLLAPDAAAGGSAEGADAAAAEPRQTGASDATAAEPTEEEALDLGSVAVVPVLKRAAPVVAALALVAVVLELVRRRSR